MNNVHEQCPNSDSETVLSPKIGWVHQVHSKLMSLHTQAHPGARVGAVSWLCPPAVSQVMCRTPGWPCRGLGCDTVPCLMPFPSHNTLCVLQYNSPVPQAASVTIQILYRDTAFLSQTSAPVTIQPTVS